MDRPRRAAVPLETTVAATLAITEELARHISGAGLTMFSDMRICGISMQFAVVMAEGVADAATLT